MTTTSSKTLKQYQTIAELTARMLEQAKDQQWQNVLTLSQDYIQAVERLKSITEPSEKEQEVRHQLLTRILKDDAEIRQLAMPELARLGHLLGDMSKQKNVVKAYCSPSFSA